EGPRVSVQGQVTGLNLARCAGLPAKVSGRASAAFDVRGSADDPVASGTVTASGLALDRVCLREAEARWNYAGGVVTLCDGRGSDPGGNARLFGTVSRDGKADLRVAVTVPSLEVLASEFGELDVAGSGYFQGRVSGSLEKPQVEGDLRLTAPRWR